MVSAALCNWIRVNLEQTIDKVWLLYSVYYLNSRQSNLNTETQLVEYRDVQNHTISTAVGRKVARVPSSCPSLTIRSMPSVFKSIDTSLAVMFSLFGRQFFLLIFKSLFSSLFQVLGFFVSLREPMDTLA